MTESMTSAEYLEYINRPKEKDPKQVIKGRAVQRDGKNFEKFIQQAHAAYDELGIASITQLPVGTNPMPKNWVHPAHQTKSGICRILSQRAPFDFYGTMGLCGPAHDPYKWRGRAVAMECKATKTWSNRLPLGEKSTLKIHQLQACAHAWTKYGTITAIVWNNGGERGVLLPDKIVEREQKYRIGVRGSKGIPWDLFMPYPLRSINDGPEIEDWLTPVLSFMKLHLEKADEAARNNYPRSRQD